MRHRVDQLVPEVRVTSLQIGIKHHVGPQLAIQAVEVLYIRIKDDDEALAPILRGGVQGESELQSTPGRLHEVFGHQDDDAP